MAIGLTPSRSGIAIGRLLNAQLRHMSVHLALSVCAARRHKLFLFGHRHAVGKLHNPVWFYKVRWSFLFHFPSLLNTLLMPVHILLLLSFKVNYLSITYNDKFSAINII